MLPVLAFAFAVELEAPSFKISSSSSSTSTSSSVIVPSGFTFVFFFFLTMSAFLSAVAASRYPKSHTEREHTLLLLICDCYSFWKDDVQLDLQFPLHSGDLVHRHSLPFDLMHTSCSSVSTTSRNGKAGPTRFRDLVSAYVDCSTVYGDDGHFKTHQSLKKKNESRRSFQHYESTCIRVMLRLQTKSAPSR